MKKIFLSLTLFIFTQSFGQTSNYDVPKRDAFQPMFSIGSGYYNSLGDIKGPDGNYLLGNMGINSGIRINLSEEIDLSLLFSSNAKLHENSGENSFESDLNSIGFNLDYTFNNILSSTKVSPFTTIGAQWMYFRTNNLPQESGVNIPVGLGISLDVSERIRFDVGMNYHLSFADIDHAPGLSSNDNFTTVNFTLHYDLFTQKLDEYDEYDESNYRNINFKAMEVADNDGDGIADIIDNCLNTPSGVKVNEFGCALDNDNDGVPNYLDEERNTKTGAVVNERGIQLTDEEYHSMYSKYEAASREYAKFYNDSEIKKDNYATINEYLIAKANAFNQKYNENNRDPKIGKRYKVQIGKFADEIPYYKQPIFLSYEDLESIPQKDGSWIYCVGEYGDINDAENRKIEVELEYSDLEPEIIVVENGNVSYYKYPIKNEEKKEEYTIKDDSTYISNNLVNNTIDSIQNSLTNNKEKIIYRVQVGFYKKELSYDIFKGLNVNPIKGNGGTYYYVGAFTNHQDALIKQSEMRDGRGFNDAFIVTFQNGERINVSNAIKTEKKNKLQKRKKKKEVEKVEISKEIENFTIKFVVQIGVWEEEINEKTKKQIESISNAEEVQKVYDKGVLYKYIAGKYDSLSEAELRKLQVEKNGFTDAFIYAEKDGKRITVKDAIKLLNQ